MSVNNNAANDVIAIAIVKLNDLKSRASDIVTDIQAVSDSLSALQSSDAGAGPAPVPVVPPIASSAVLLTTITAKESANVDRSSSFVRCAVPVPQSTKLVDIYRVHLLDSRDKMIVADVRPTSWWDDGSIQWVQIYWVDSLKALESKSYKITIGESSLSADPSKVTCVIDNTNTATVNTGSATFTIGAEGLFRSLKYDDLELKGSATSFTADGQTDGFSLSAPRVRRMEVEYAGQIVCYLIVETVSISFTSGTLSNGKPAYISTTRRYQFVAGSSLVTVESVIKYEGTKNGSEYLLKDGVTVNGVLLTKWVDSFSIDPVKVDTTPTTTSISLRPDRRKARQESVTGLTPNPGLIYIPVQNSHVNMIAGLKYMENYEPQSISFANGNITITHANDQVWLAHHQGAFTACVIGFTEQSAFNVDADLSQPMIAFAPPSYYSTSGRSIPSPDLSYFKQYMDSLTLIHNKTQERIAKDGLYGLQVYGWWPRYWDDSYVETSDNNPTWDTLYKTTAFTDYYSVTRSMVTLALMTGDPSSLRELAFPAAQRMLWTQIMQTDPQDPWVYGCWAPAGYGCGRSDFNSSHSYYENLMWYYLLTGNKLVIDIIARGEERMIREVSSQPLAGRFPHQRLRAWRFLSQAHPDSGKRDMFRQAWLDSMKRAIDQCYVEGSYQGEVVAFWADGQKKKGTNITPNLYALSIWDLESLWQYGVYVDNNSNNTVHTIVIADKFTKLVKTIQRYGSIVVSGDGSLSKDSKWARAFSFDWDGQSTITNVKVQPDTDNYLYMYPGDLPGMCASWARAAKSSQDSVMKDKAKQLVEYTLGWIKDNNQPLNKVTGLADSTLADAVSLL